MRTNSFRSFVFNCSDPFDDALTYVIDSQPAHGHASGSGQSRTLSAGPDEGDATFTWHAHGSQLGRQRDADAGRHDRRRRQHGADVPVLELERQARRAADDQPVLR